MADPNVDLDLDAVEALLQQERNVSERKRDMSPLRKKESSGLDKERRREKGRERSVTPSRDKKRKQHRSRTRSGSRGRRHREDERERHEQHHKPDREREKDRDKERENRGYPSRNPRDGKDDKYRERDKRDRGDRGERGDRDYRESRADRDHKERNEMLKREEREQRMLIDRQIEEARRQALEAQRDDCTVLVLRLHIDAVEKDVFKLFASNNIGRVIDIKIIRDQRSGKSKGVAYVEFESQESVLLAVALTNQQILGQSIIVQTSQAEKNRTAAAAKYKKEMIKEQQIIHSMKSLEPVEMDLPMKIFVGGLENMEMSENEVRKLFPFGDIDFIELQRDDNTGRIKGYIFIQFRKTSQAKLAIKEMNGCPFSGKHLKVGEAHTGSSSGNIKFLPSGDMDDDHGGLLHNVQSRHVLMQKLNRDGVGFGSGIGGYALPSGMTPAPSHYGNNTFLSNQMNLGPQVSQSNCVVISNLFDTTVDLQKEPNFYNEIYEDVYEECVNYGKISLMWLDQNSQGNVWIKFEGNNFQAADVCVSKLNGRNFDKRKLSARLVSEGVFNSAVPGAL